MAKRRVVIATPSSIDRSRIARTLGQTADYEVVAQTIDLSATYTRVEELMPDLVIIAPVFMQSAEYVCMQGLFDAVEACVVPIDDDPTPRAQSGGAAQQNGLVLPRMAPEDLAQCLSLALRNDNRPALRPPPMAMRPLRVDTMDLQSDKIILIGASTGGIDALTTILRHFPKNCPPTAVVQHTGRNFSATLASLLDRHSAPDVILAEDGLTMQPGRICLAGGLDGHLKFNRDGATTTCRVVQGPATSGHTPSIDEMFFSAVPFASRVIGVILTGMGRDGASGLLELRKAGAITLGQDQGSSVVYGMPRVAQEIGAVQTQLPLSDIGPSLLRLCQTQQPQRIFMGHR